MGGEVVDSFATHLSRQSTASTATAILVVARLASPEVYLPPLPQPPRLSHGAVEVKGRKVSDGNRYGIKTDRDGLVVFQEVQRVTRMSASTIKRRIKEARFPPALPNLPRPKWERADIQTYLAWAGTREWKPWQPPY